MAQRLTVPSPTRARGCRESREGFGPRPPPVLPAPGVGGVGPAYWGRPRIPAAPSPRTSVTIGASSEPLDGSLLTIYGIDGICPALDEST